MALTTRRRKIISPPFIALVVIAKETVVRVAALILSTITWTTPASELDISVFTSKKTNLFRSSCYTHFTPGQEVRMYSQWSEYRTPHKQN